MEIRKEVYEEIELSFRDTLTWDNQSISPEALIVWREAEAAGDVTSISEMTGPYTRKLTLEFKDQATLDRIDASTVWARLPGFVVTSVNITNITPI